MGNKPQIALVTGASSGIGRAIAVEFAARGYHVIAVARRLDLLKLLEKELTDKNRAPGGFESLLCDVGDWPSVAGVVKEVTERHGQINVLINNAGAFDYCPLEKATPQSIDKLIDVNVRGTIAVTRAALPLLKQSVAKGESACIVNISSLSGLWGFANMAPYTATKFAVTGFTSALRRELRPQGITVLGIFPGPVNNKVQTRAEAEKHRRLTMYPNEIARQVWGAVENKKENVVSHLAFDLLRRLESVSPRWVDKIFKRIS